MNPNFILAVEDLERRVVGYEVSHGLTAALCGRNLHTIGTEEGGEFGVLGIVVRFLCEPTERTAKETKWLQHSAKVSN